MLDSLGRFTREDAELAEALAAQAALNLHNARLYDESITDQRTGLRNARHFEDSLGRLVAQTNAGQPPFALAVTDVDHFKRFNDTYGHKAGDFVLQELARLLRRAARVGSGDATFRYGGEEFCMLLPATEAATACQVLEALRVEVAGSRFDWNGTELGVTISVGICEFTAGDDRTAFFERADSALYAAKEAGRNQVFCWAEGGARPGLAGVG